MEKRPQNLALLLSEGQNSSSLFVRPHWGKQCQTFVRVCVSSSKRERERERERESVCVCMYVCVCVCVCQHYFLLL